MDAIDALKQKVLTLAIQGKLVPQNPNDEPASELLKKIKAEKAELVKQGKIKKDKQESYIYKGADNTYYEKNGLETKDITEEIPFEIPENWEWVRLKDIVTYNMGKTPDRGNKKYWNENTIPWVSISDMLPSQHIKTTKEKISQLALNDIFKKKISPKGTLLMSFKLTVGRTSIIDFDAVHNEAIISIYPYNCCGEIFKTFLLYFLPLFSSLAQSHDAIKGKTLNSKSIDNIFIPIPSIAEQQEIIKVFEKLKKEINTVQANQEELSKLKDGLKSKILDLAIQGKLVEQDPNDEPASVLLEKIRAEKQELIKQGKIKKDKQESYIYKGADNRHYEKIGSETKDITDEIPFEIPESWSWCRLGSVVNYGETKAVTYPECDKNLWILDLEDIEKDSSKILCKNRIKDKPFKSTKKTFQKGDVLYSKLRPYLNKVVVADENGVCTSEILPLRAYYGIEATYLQYCLKSYYFYQYVNQLTYGVKMPRLGTEDGKKGLIPIPPLKEQQKIIQKLSKIQEIIGVL